MRRFNVGRVIVLNNPLALYFALVDVSPSEMVLKRRVTVLYTPMLLCDLGAKYTLVPTATAPP